MEQTIRFETDIEKDYNRKQQRNPYGGSCDWCRNIEEELYPWCDTFCMRCTSRMYVSDDILKSRIDKGNRIERNGLCRGCGHSTSSITNHVEIQLFLCKTCFKLVRKYDMFNNTKDTRAREDKHIKQMIKQDIEALGL